jgi:FixJ family two-component response regulator
LAALKERFETLTSREREIMIQVTAGRLNKQIASDIAVGSMHVIAGSAALFVVMTFDQAF